MPASRFDVQTEHLLRELAPQVLGSVARRFRDFAAAEDAVQEAMIAAAEQWQHEGVPANPRGWLLQVALRRMTDHVRREVARRDRESQVADEAPLIVAPALYAEPGMDPNDTLALLFMCCHPSLSSASSIALTLRAVGGLTTSEIAKAFLVPEATMAQRISRAKQSIVESNVPFSLPESSERAARLASVMHVLYLMFNEGYTASSGDLLSRVDLSDEAIRLTRMLRAAVPEEPEVLGLLALMLLTDARRAARTGPDGELIALDEQDRSRWDREKISEGTRLVQEALEHGHVGEYQIQAAIAALHDDAASADVTDWPQILALYEVLQQILDNPMVTLSLAIASAMVNGAEVGLQMLKTLDDDPRVNDSHRLAAVRGHLFERSGDVSAAIDAYRIAANRTSSIPERNYLMLRAARLAEKLVS